MSFQIKICGLSTSDTLNSAVTAGADMVGFVFFPRSPRHIEPKTAAHLVTSIRGHIEIVALSVDADDAYLDKIVTELRPGWLQLHGHESPQRVTELRQRYGCKIIKAIGVSDHDDLVKTESYADVVDCILLDAKPPKDATRPGGLGKVFDWQLLQDFHPDISYMLSGGLKDDNVAEALHLTHAPGVDVSSGIESQPGVKDHDKIIAFIREARLAAKNLGLGFDNSTIIHEKA